jgi:uncharacterized protein (TIGR00255 family)
MLQSMTGFGRSSKQYESKTINVEIRSVNSKMADIRFKLPLNYKDKELDLRRILMEQSDRGKIDISISIKSQDGDEGFALNKQLFKKYYNELKSLCAELGLPENDILSAVLRIPTVISNDESNIDENEWEAVLETYQIALDDFAKYRAIEGDAMKVDLILRIDNIMQLLTTIAPFEKERIVKMKGRIRQNLEEFLGKENVDENRFEQEVLFYLEKIDVTEEKVRLEQHCKYFVEQVAQSNTVKGRTLSFISQEIGREINTLGAKAYSADIQHLVVQMKDELEKIKEQVANLV